MIHIVLGTHLRGYVRGPLLCVAKGIQDIHRRIFAAMLSNMDDSVGAILKKLRDERLEENTLVFFISDNGGPTRDYTGEELRVAYEHCGHTYTPQAGDQGQDPGQCSCTFPVYSTLGWRGWVWTKMD